MSYKVHGVSSDDEDEMDTKIRDATERLRQMHAPNRASSVMAWVLAHSDGPEALSRAQMAASPRTERPSSSSSARESKDGIPTAAPAPTRGLETGKFRFGPDMKDSAATGGSQRGDSHPFGVGGGARGSGAARSPTSVARSPTFMVGRGRYRLGGSNAPEELALVFELGSKDTIIPTEYFEKFRAEYPEYLEHKAYEMQTADGLAMFHGACYERRYYELVYGAVVFNLRRAGLDVHEYGSVSNDKRFVTIGATEDRLLLEATRRREPMPLDRDEVVDAVERRNLPLWHVLRDGKHDLCDNMYGPIQSGPLGRPDPATLALLQRKKNGAYLRPGHRVKLLLSIVHAAVVDGGAGVQLENIKHRDHDPLIDYFPLHDREHVDYLCSRLRWMYPTSASLIDELARYLGEQVGFYFAFLRCYTVSILPLAALGCATFARQLFSQSFDVEMSFLLAIFVSLWGPYFIKYWKQTSSWHSVAWGMTTFKQREGVRSEYYGERRRSEVDGSELRRAPLADTLCRRLLSWSLVVLICSGSAAAVLSLFLYRRLFLTVSHGKTLFSTVYGIAIVFMNMLYGWLAAYLNDFENHRTHSQYENGLVTKTFVLKFFNSYAILFYYAFLKQYDRDYPCKNSLQLPESLADDSTCLSQLRFQLLVQTLTQMIFGNLMEFGAPWLFYKLGRFLHAARGVCCCGRSGDGSAAVLTVSTRWRQRTQVERQYGLSPYLSPLGDFDEIVLQYGYMSMFIVVFPLAPILAIIYNLIEKRLDSFKILRTYRRPIPRGTNGIGAWKHSIQAIAYIALITNLLLLTTNRVPTALWGTSSSAITSSFIFIILEHTLLLAMYFMDKALPDRPHRVEEHTKRQAHITAELLGR